MRRRLIAVLLAALMLVLIVGGCAAQESDTPAEQPSATEPTTGGDGAGGDDAPGAASDDVVQGTMGGLTVIGPWTVNVREIDWDSGNDDVSVPGGMTRLEAEVDLRNSTNAPVSVTTAEWSLVDDGGTTYEVLASSRPEKQGERTIGSGEVEDVSVNFAVPSRSGIYTLRFQPTGSDMRLEVPLR